MKPLPWKRALAGTMAGIFLASAIYLMVIPSTHWSVVDGGVAAGACALLAGCMNLAPKYERPAAPVPATFAGDTGPGAPGPQAAEIAWQQYFGDARLRRHGTCSATAVFHFNKRWVRAFVFQRKPIRPVGKSAARDARFDLVFGPLSVRSVV